MDKGEAGGSAKWINKFQNVNTVDFAKIDRGGLPRFSNFFFVFLFFLVIVLFTDYKRLNGVLYAEFPPAYSYYLYFLSQTKSYKRWQKLLSFDIGGRRVFAVLLISPGFMKFLFPISMSKVIIVFKASALWADAFYM